VVVVGLRAARAKNEAAEGAGRGVTIAKVEGKRALAPAKISSSLRDGGPCVGKGRGCRSDPEELRRSGSDE